jgi:uncharacterised protein family (UPF0150)
MYYPVVFSWDGEGYQLYAPDVKGANAYSEGDNLEAAMHTAQWALSAMLTANYQDYPPASRQEDIDLHESDDFIVMVQGIRTVGEDVQITLSMPDYVLSAIDEAASRQGISRAAYIANLALGH